MPIEEPSMALDRRIMEAAQQAAASRAVAREASPSWWERLTERLLAPSVRPVMAFCTVAVLVGGIYLYQNQQHSGLFLDRKAQTSGIQQLKGMPGTPIARRAPAPRKAKRAGTIRQKALAQPPQPNDFRKETKLPKPQKPTAQDRDKPARRAPRKSNDQAPVVTGRFAPKKQDTRKRPPRLRRRLAPTIGTVGLGFNDTKRKAKKPKKTRRASRSRRRRTRRRVNRRVQRLKKTVRWGLSKQRRRKDKRQLSQETYQEKGLFGGTKGRTKNKRVATAPRPVVTKAPPPPPPARRAPSRPDAESRGNFAKPPPPFRAGRGGDAPRGGRAPKRIQTHKTQNLDDGYVNKKKRHTHTRLNTLTRRRYAPVRKRYAPAPKAPTMAPQAAPTRVSKRSGEILGFAPPWVKAQRKAKRRQRHARYAYQQGEQYYQRRQFRSALRAYKRALTGLPSSSKAIVYRRIGIIYTNLGRQQQADQAFQQYIQTSPPNKRRGASEFVVRVYRYRGRYDKAIQLLQSLQRNYPSYRAHYQRQINALKKLK